MITTNPINNLSNNMKPLTTKINGFNQNNSFNIFNDISQKTLHTFNETQREFGKDLTNQNNLTTFNKENNKRIQVNKNIKINQIKKDDFKTNEINLNGLRRQKSQDNNNYKKIFSEKENKQNYSSNNIQKLEEEDIQMEDLTQNTNNQTEPNINIDKIKIENITNNIKENKKKENEDIEMKNIDFSQSKIQNPQNVEEYFTEIYLTLKSTEEQFLPDSNYMSKRSDINSKMRSILLDWLVEVHLKYKLLPETLYITTNIIDRYLSKKDIKRTKLQLVGVTSMFIASKYEDIYPPEVKDFSYITDNAYTNKEILKMEMEILTTLNFNITFPTPYRFIEIYRKLLNLDDKTFCFSWFCIELCLIEYKMIKYKPSFLAASAVFCAHRLLDLDENGVAEKMGFTYQDIKLCCLEICNLIDQRKKSNLKGVYKKFSLEKYYKLSLMSYD